MKEDQNYTIQPAKLSLSYKGKEYAGLAIPVQSSCREGVCFKLSVFLNGKQMGIISCGNDLHWTMEGIDQGLTDAIGEKVLLWYE